MRNWPERRERRARIEIIPMIDVMMFLLVFFVLISINVLPALGLKITPPSSAKPDQMTDRVRITVGIDREGATFIDGQPVPLADLAERLRLAAGEKTPSVAITGDEGSTLQNLVSVLDALKTAGIANAQIVARPK
jgi:biopolymer transport protein ExbD